MNTADLDLEARIEFAAMLLATRQTPTERRQVWDDLKALVGQRSPEAIRELERERGLA